MKRKKLGVIFVGLVVLIACQPNQKKDSTVSVQHRTIEKNTSESISIASNNFDFSRYKIAKGAIGDIKIGATVSEVNKILYNLEMKEFLSTDLGFDGGSPAYVYYSKKDPLLAVVSALDSDTVVFLVAFDPKLTTSNGIHPGMTTGELLDIYPDLRVHQDYLNDWEFAEDSLNNWSFVFATKENNQVAEYSEFSVPTIPKRLDIKCDWINIY